MTKKFTINDGDREDHVRNSEGLYLAWKREMKGEHKIREFVRKHRAEIDKTIRQACGQSGES